MNQPEPSNTILGATPGTPSAAPAPPYRSEEAANYFLSRDKLTQMQLHKLLYFSHGWLLAIEGTPLVIEKFEAWKFGPMLPSLYLEFMHFGGDPITIQACYRYPDPRAGQTASAINPEDQKTYEVLERVREIYGGLSGPKLSSMTHKVGAPWHSTVNGVDRDTVSPFDHARPVIKDDMIKEYFTKLVVKVG